MPITVSIENAQANLYQYLNQLDAGTLDKVIVNDSSAAGAAELLQIVTAAVYLVADPGGAASAENDVVTAYSSSPAVQTKALYKLTKNMRDRQAAPDALKAVGTITCVTFALLLDTETVTLTDVGGTAIEFEFDKDGGGIVGSGVQVNITGAVTANDVAVILAAAINAQAEFVAPAPGAAIVGVTQADPGISGNTPITEAVANGGFTVTGFTGGLDANASGGVIALKNSKNDTAARAYLVPADHAAAIGL